MASLNSRIPPSPKSLVIGHFLWTCGSGLLSQEASLLQQEDWLVMTKATLLRGQCVELQGVILGNHSFFLRVHEFGVIPQTREADRVVQTRNYGMK